MSLQVPDLGNMLLWAVLEIYAFSITFSWIGLAATNLVVVPRKVFAYLGNGVSFFATWVRYLGATVVLGLLLSLVLTVAANALGYAMAAIPYLVKV